MKKRNLIEVLFICILGVTGWYLLDVMKQVESTNPELKIIESYNRLVFSDGTGIDIMGKYVDSVLANNADQVERFVVAFLLRQGSLDSDLRFWNEVNNYLSGLDTTIVKLIAYCENGQCVEDIKKNPDRADFPVLEYGEVSDMQAVISADIAGEFWLRGNSYKKIKWRDENLTPFDIAMSIGL